MKNLLEVKLHDGRLETFPQWKWYILEVWFWLGGSVWILIAGILIKIQVMFFRLTIFIIFRRLRRTKMKKKIWKKCKMHNKSSVYLRKGDFPQMKKVRQVLYYTEEKNWFFFPQNNFFPPKLGQGKRIWITGAVICSSK